MFPPVNGVARVVDCAGALDGVSLVGVRLPFLCADELVSVKTLIDSVSVFGAFVRKIDMISSIIRVAGWKS